MVALHKLHVKLLTAQGTAVFLLLPYCQLDVLGEGAEVKLMLVAGKDKRYDTLLPLHLAVAHKG